MPAEVPHLLPAVAIDHPPRSAKQTSPGTADCAPDSSPVARSLRPARTGYPDAVAPRSPASSPVPAPLPPSACLTHPLASPACSQKSRSDSQSPLSPGSPPASRSPRPPVPTTSPTAPPIPPTASCTTLSPAAGSAPSTPPSTPHSAPLLLPHRCNLVVLAAHGPPVTPIPPALPADSSASILPAPAAPPLPSTSAATPHNPHTAPPIQAMGLLLHARTLHTAHSIP